MNTLIPEFHHQGISDDTTANEVQVTGQVDGQEYELVSVNNNRVYLNFDFLQYESFLLNEDYYQRRPPISSRLPFKYTYIPVELRNYLLRLQKWKEHLLTKIFKRTIFPAWPIEASLDALRWIIYSQAARLAGINLNTRPYPGGKQFGAMVTHDIETADGLRWIENFRMIERGYGIPSAWSIISYRYFTSDKILENLLSEGCEILSHGYLHDGKLPYLCRSEIKNRLQHLFVDKPWLADYVNGFRCCQLLRSPILSEEISHRFRYDLSVPDTEKYGVYRQTRGCASVFPFYNPFGTLEIPLTMPQDFMLKHIHHYPKNKILQIWKYKIDYISQIGGVAVLDIHPDPYISGNEVMLKIYDELLTYLVKKRACFLTPKSAYILFGTGDSEREGD
jgi:peptidoglycan/xylan/chitin deacetylase (PgdA/CDA1 family)